MQNHYSDQSKRKRATRWIRVHFTPAIYQTRKNNNKFHSAPGLHEKFWILDCSTITRELWILSSSARLSFFSFESSAPACQITAVKHMRDAEMVALEGQAPGWAADRPKGASVCCLDTTWATPTPLLSTVDRRINQWERETPVSITISARAAAEPVTWRPPVPPRRPTFLLVREELLPYLVRKEVQEVGEEFLAAWGSLGYRPTGQQTALAPLT
jgi:hypothetical protein